MMRRNNRMFTKGKDKIIPNVATENLMVLQIG
jgi:hypothetical protein